uniref:Uncharacterized protein n=1 Tax=Romanomermis culicivorax TaxID=13658 RepID=A0A915J5G3_ROMCU
MPQCSVPSSKIVSVNWAMASRSVNISDKVFMPRAFLNVVWANNFVLILTILCLKTQQIVFFNKSSRTTLNKTIFTVSSAIFDRKKAFLPPGSKRPNRKMTTRSYSLTTFNVKHIENGKVIMIKNQDNMVNTKPNQ